jgi:hypothetical protein
MNNESLTLKLMLHILIVDVRKLVIKLYA